MLRNLLNFASILSLVAFLFGFFWIVGVGDEIAYYLLTGSLILKVLEVGFEWYHFWALSERREDNKLPEKAARVYSVDMLTTACPGEPYDMIEETLTAMVAVTYPHTSYLCDEGNDPKLKALCNRLGAIHVTRETHENAKAGNINNALRGATGELCVILDPDHVPFPDFLDHVVHHFDDSEVGYVQIVQAYKNQSESLVAHAAAEQTYMYYGPYMEAMGTFGTAQAIGANCTFRRTALDSIGGHAPGLTEDMHTAMLLHAKGWKSVYEPKVLSLGLVPSSLAAYYQQQLKWSRGTFDLWLNKLPKLFSSFTFRQKLHYFLLPIYFLFGFVGLIDVGVPIYSLITGEYPWLLNPTVFFAIFLPFLSMSMLQRHYAQHWLHSRNEKGLHLLGGILRVGTWWIYILGFVYTLINKKVPYIPTPKEHSSKGDFLLGLPNLIVSIVSFSAAMYGVSVDWQPYSWMMASFAISNSIIFFAAFLMGQYLWVQKIRAAWYWLKTRPAVESLELTYVKISRVSLPVSATIPLVLGILFLFSALNFKFNELPVEMSISKKQYGSFYTGLYEPNFDLSEDLRYVENTEVQSDHQWSILSTYLKWSSPTLPEAKWRQIISHGAIPMITWQPYLDIAQDSIGQDSAGVFQQILAGHFDGYIIRMAETVRDLNAPVFLRFAPDMDDPKFPWSAAFGNTSEEFKEAWKHVHYLFESVGAQNVSWVFSPNDPKNIAEYYPYGSGGSTTELVDWVGFTALNYGSASNAGRSGSFDELYSPFQEELESLEIEVPVMLAEFGSASFSTDPEAWNIKSLNTIRNSHPEIKAIVWYYSSSDDRAIADWKPSGKVKAIDWTFDLSTIARSIAIREVERLPVQFLSTASTPLTRPKNLRGTSGDFSLQVDGEPFYMKGICYNNGHDWEEGFKPLSRKQVAGDFEKMKQAGANTIRRYEPGVYDRNILKEAKEQDMKIMYGFWFDPKVDYVADEDELRAYEKKVLKYVKKYQHEESIIAWNIGNETWGLLKKRYGQPYLTVVRKRYVTFLENLAQKIHEIDPSRPVFSSEEHDNVRLIGAIHDFKHHAPSLDAIGINSYYEENISDLSQIFETFDNERPYAVTEFGPKGYWNKELGDFWNDSILVEVSSVAKAQYYHKQWSDYIEANKGRNLGGFAFSWQDRFEGTATWFGITDFNGNPKPAYHYLASAWLGTEVEDAAFPDLSIVGNWQGVRKEDPLWLTAAVTNNYTDSLTFKWEIYEEGTWKRSNPVIQGLLNDKYVEIAKPAKKSRIYVYAYDTRGNVITASRPLIVLN
ncbi:glycosyltransferase [Lunatimonas salinarum]|uniref:glycosyltransferase n=1 Tax=Lunatimonas salinarum TaxID=1774590 RepID=UPI001AE0B601|nr:glycosyltransferase [Lunatimonas salinarum]